MCGIAGFTGPINSAKLEQMLGLIEHRGPDGEGTLKKPDFSFGMRRLAIIDPESGWQPIWNEDKSIAIVFNGEIYNYRELWKELQAAGHQFSTDHSDTETIVHAYEEWGTDCVKRFRGMFAFALWDSNKNLLWIARDPLGIKPVYYSIFDNRLIFASEIKAITKTWDLDRSPDDASVYKFLLYRLHDSNDHTFFKEVKRLLPGHQMLINLGTEKPEYIIEKYWHPKVNSSFMGNKTDADYAAEFKEKFIETIRLHLVSDVPLGVALSGGLDSSGITSLTHRLRSEGVSTHTSDLLTFSTVYPGQTIDESEYIQEVVDYTGAKMHTTEPSADDFWAEIDKWIYYQEEPTISTAPYAYYSMYRMSSNHVRVMLSGNGGDELLAGYIPYFSAYISTARDQGATAAAIREMLMGLDIYGKYIWQKLKTMLVQRQQVTMSQLLKPQFVQGHKDAPELNFTNLRNLNERLLQDVTYSSVPNLTRYDDKNSMAFSIESRPPFLDHKLVEYIFGLPADQKIKYGWNRYVYRNAMKGLMPEKIRKRRSKIGFTNPELTWLKSKANLYQQVFSSDQFRSRPYWDAESVNSSFQRVLNGGSGDILIFWRLLNTELWMRSYCD